MVSPRVRTAFLFWGASALFFLSGGTGLAYQVVWFKRFSHVWGSSTLAMAAVVASFLTGLGLGAHLMGRISDRIKGPLFWYGVSEAAIGLLAVLIPLEIKGLMEVSSLVYPLFSGSPLIHSMVRYFFTFLVLGPICMLMGGTLPLLLKHFIPPDSTPRESAGWLYAINTLGAAVGCYLAGFHLLPSLGLNLSNLLVALLNLAIGAAAILIYKSTAQAEAAPAPSPVDPRAKQRPREYYAPAPEARSLAGLYIVVTLTGCAALILEMVWTRQLALILGGSTYAFSAMLALLLVGIGLGSMIFHLWFRKMPDLGLAPALVIAGLGIASVLGKLFIPELSIIVGLLKDMRGAQVWNASISIFASMVLELLPAIGMGILFPMFVELTRKRAADAGKAIGTIYAWNTVGSILGATLTSLILVPWIGAAASIALALAMYTVALIMMLPFPKTAREAVVALVLIQVMCGATYLSTREPDPRITNIGMYMYGYTGHEAHRYKLEYFKEGASSNVLVTSQNEHFSLRVNGKVDASSAGDMAMQLGLAYLPIFLVPDATDLLVIGFGSGTTSGASLLFPNTRVTCCEIEPSVFEASKFFAKVNHSPQKWLNMPLDKPRFSVVFDDGRSHLQGTSDQYDIILSEPSNPWIAGVSNLFTREFYEAAKERLKPNGILAQWIQMYSFKPADYAMIANTVMDVFPHCGLIRISDGDTVLLASATPITATKDSMLCAQAMVDGLPAVKADLNQYFGLADVRSLLLNNLLLDTAALKDMVAKDEELVVNTDLNMRLEFDAPLRLFGGDRRKQVMKRILSSARKDWFEKASVEWGCGKEQAEAFHTLSGLFDRSLQKDLVLGLVDTGLTLDPRHAALLTDKIILSGDLTTEQFTALVTRLFDVSQKEMNRLGVSLFQENRFEHAVIVFLKILTIHPESVTTHNNLAVAYEAWGKIDQAQEAFERALSVDPLSEFAKKSYAAFQEKHNKRPGGGPGIPPVQVAPKDGSPLPESSVPAAPSGGAGDHAHDHDHDGSPPAAPLPPESSVPREPAPNP